MPLLGFQVEVAPVSIDEQALGNEAPQDTALRVAEEKAASRLPTAAEVVVGADTVVVVDGQLLGKPGNEAEARQMLHKLRGRCHEVISGIALVSSVERYRRAIRTWVEMRAYSNEEVERYIHSGRPFDKAGAYAIQDGDFHPVGRIVGCYLNVVGLPLCEVSRGLRALGWPLPDEPYQPPCRWCSIGRAALEEGRVTT